MKQQIKESKLGTSKSPIEDLMTKNQSQQSSLTAQAKIQIKRLLKYRKKNHFKKLIFTLKNPNFSSEFPPTSSFLRSDLTIQNQSQNFLYPKKIPELKMQINEILRKNKKKRIIYPTIRRIMANANQLIPLVWSSNHSTICIHFPLLYYTTNPFLFCNKWGLIYWIFQKI